MSRFGSRKRQSDPSSVIGKLQRGFILSAALILLTACLPAGLGIGEPPETPSPPALTATPPPTASATETAVPTPLPTATPEPRLAIQHVLIISFDGLRPDAIEQAPMPNLLALMQGSAYTLSARTIFPSSTLPSHSSMLTGLCPSKHGVTWNDYIPENGYAAGNDLFDLAHAAGYKTGMFVGKEKLRQVTEPASTDVFEYINDRDSVILDRAIHELPQDFGLLFIHLPTADGMGHEYGWLSPEQFSVLFRADEALGRLLVELGRLGLQDEILIIITADHGGHGTTHGTNRPEDMTIPWIASGPGIIPIRLTTPVETMDTAATAAWALGLPIPPDWDGRPVTEAFGLSLEVQPAVLCL